MVGSMKSDRKKSFGKKGGANPKASNKAARSDLARQYEDLCRLREKVRALSEKARSLRPKGRDWSH
jgi:hypothetical protein